MKLLRLCEAVMVSLKRGGGVWEGGFSSDDDDDYELTGAQNDNIVLLCYLIHDGQLFKV